VPHTLPALVFLGIDDRQHASTQGVPMSVDPSRPEGVPYFALEATEDFEVEGGIWEDARNSASAMDGWTAGIFAQGRALIDWNVRNKV
jgi:NAD+ diphosphatase